MADTLSSQRTSTLTDLPYQDSGRVGAGTIGGPAFANLAPRPTPVTVGSPGAAYKGVLEFLLPDFNARADEIRAKNRGELVSEPAATPAPATTPAPPTTANVAPKPVAGAEKAPARTPDFTTKDTSTPEIKRIDQKGQAPLFTNLEPAAAVAEMKGNPLGVVPAGASPFGSLSSSTELSAALQAAAERGDWAAIQNHYQKGGGTWQGQTAEQSARQSLLTSLQPGKAGVSRKQGEILASLLNAGQQNATQQTQAQASLMESLGRNALNTVQVQQAQQLQQAYHDYFAAKTPDEQTKALKALTLLKGAPQQDRFTVVPGGQEWDPTAGPMGAMRNVPARVLNNQTGQFVGQPDAPKASITMARVRETAKARGLSEAQVLEVLKQHGHAVSG